MKPELHVKVACAKFGRCQVEQQHWPGRHHATAANTRLKWSKDVNVIVIGALGCVSMKFEQWIERIGMTVNIEDIQKTTLLGTARILRRVLEN